MTTPTTIQGLPPRPSSRPLAAAGSTFSVVFLITMIICTAVTFILPESYSSTARIKVDATTTNYDPYFIQTEFEIIQSQVVLERVIKKLNLNEIWGKKYFNGEMLKTKESLQILKGRLSLVPVRGTKLVAITVFSDDRHEAAILANAVAEAYRDFSTEQQKASAAKAADARVIADPPVLITDLAEPASRPCKPNKPLNLALGAFAGVVLGSIAAGLVYGFRRER